LLLHGLQWIDGVYDGVGDSLTHKLIFKGGKSTASCSLAFGFAMLS